MLPKNRPPTTPGEMLVEEFLDPAGITQAAFAERIGMSPQQLNPILRGKHAVSARVALKFSQALGTSPEFWMNLQARVDLWNEQRRGGVVGKILSLFENAPTRRRPLSASDRMKRKTRDGAKRGPKSARPRPPPHDVVGIAGRESVKTVKKK